MRPEGILAAWEAAHDTLREDHREAFLRRQELDALSQMPDGAVVSAMGKSPKLAEILTVAAEQAWWFRGEACEPDGLEWCARCKPHPYPAVVVMTKGWSQVFHGSADCPGLLGGQFKVEQRGGEVAQVEKVPIQVALAAGRVPCRVCRPQ
jgi:hypothetical protein